MTTAVELTLEERLAQLLAELSIERAHVAALVPNDYQAAVAAASTYAASLALICPPGVLPSVAAFDSRLLLATGDSGPQTEQVRRLTDGGVRVEQLVLAGFSPWQDVAAKYVDVLAPALLDFLDRQNARAGVAAVSVAEGEGEVAGIIYRVRGSGPPLVLFPLGFAASQWEPLVPRLAERYCTIVLGGAHLGIVVGLERRAATSGYRRMFRTLIETVDLRPGEAILDVGCGSGALDRLLAEWTGGANPITAVDHNRAFLSEAAALARSAGMSDVITFREGNAEALPFPDASFDVVLSCTVAEEGDAGQMIAEFVRVTKPGGRVGVIVRAMDFGVWLGVPLRPELKAKLEAPGVVGSVDMRGCADASLYRRCQEAGLELLLATPQFSGPVPGDESLGSLRFFEPSFLARMNPQEAQEWHAALTAGLAEGTLSAAMVHHCAVGRKP